MRGASRATSAAFPRFCIIHSSPRQPPISISQGGIREPAFAHWPGRIPASVSDEVVTTYDILPTVASIVGADLPQDRIYDGMDISDVLFKNGTSPHNCLFIYKGSTNYGCPSGMKTCPGLWAVRCGVYKMQ